MFDSTKTYGPHAGVRFLPSEVPVLTVAGPMGSIFLFPRIGGGRRGGGSEFPT